MDSNKNTNRRKKLSENAHGEPSAKKPAQHGGESGLSEHHTGADDVIVLLDDEPRQQRYLFSTQTGRNSLFYHHFEHDSGCYADKNMVYICKLCTSFNPKRRVKAGRNGVGNLKSHLRVHHEQVYNKLVAEEGKQASRQTRILSHVKSTQDLGHAHVDFLFSMSKNNLPFRYAESKEHRRFLQTLNGDFTMMSAKHYRSVLLPRLYNTVLRVAIAKMREQEYTVVSATTDGWTSKSYAVNAQSLTLHTVSAGERINQQSSLLQVDGAHTAARLQQAMDLQLSEMGVEKGEVAAILRDGASNITKACTDGGLLSFTCGMHQLHLVVMDVLGDKSSLGVIKNSICLTQAAVTFFRASPKRKNQLKNCCKTVEIDYKELQKSVVTRWDSILDMIQSLLQMQKAVMLWDVQHGQDDDDVRTLTRTPKIWILLQQIHRLLLPITLTSKCLGKADAHIGEMWPRVYSLRQTLEIEPDDEISHCKVFILKICSWRYIYLAKTHHFQEMRKFILINLNKRFSPPMVEKWQPTDAEAVRPMATILDPRYKDATSANGDHNWRKINMYEMATALLDKIYASKKQSQPMNESPTKSTDASPTTSNILLSPGRSPHSRAVMRKPIPQVAEQVKMFIETCRQVDNDEFNLFKFMFETYAMDCPELYLLHRFVHSIPASSVPCERLHSIAGSILTPNRNRLQCSAASMLIFVAGHADDDRTPYYLLDELPKGWVPISLPPPPEVKSTKKNSRPREQDEEYESEGEQFDIFSSSESDNDSDETVDSSSADVAMLRLKNPEAYGLGWLFTTGTGENSDDA